MRAADRAALACFAAAAAWPAAMGWMTHLMMSPLERALRSAWCGVSYHVTTTEVLAHCAACWTGSAAFVAAGLWLLDGFRPSLRQQQREARGRQ